MSARLSDLKELGHSLKLRSEDWNWLVAGTHPCGVFSNLLVQFKGKLVIGRLFETARVRQGQQT